MIVAPILIFTLASQGTKASEMRTVDVRPAGLAVSVPKSWAQNPRDGNLSASLKVPLAGSKVFGKLDVGYVDDESKDVDGFLEAAKTILLVGGNTIERQWKVDIMTSPLALTRFTKGTRTTVRGVLFRPMKSKFMISVSAPTDAFDKVEPYLFSTLESIKEVKIVAAKSREIATESKIHISPVKPSPIVRLALKQAVSVGGKTLYIGFPAGCVVKKSGDATVSCSVPGLSQPVSITAYLSDGNPPSLVFQTKAAESSKLFRGSVQRIDETSSNHGDRQVRDYIWRTGISEKTGSPLFTCNCVTTQASPMFLSSFYQQDGTAQSARDRAKLSVFLDMIRLTDQ
jgi:hypothetical protein